MPDISLCRKNTCPSKNKCFRYRAIPRPYMQPYADFSLKDGDDKCGHFINIKGWPKAMIKEQDD